MTPELPAARDPQRYAVALVCLGNICRSPTAHVVLDAAVVDAGLSDRVTVSSCGTAGWHVGKPMDPRAAATLAESGYDPSRHRARRFESSWMDTHDLVLAMDRANLADLESTVGPSARLRLFRDFDPEAPAAGAESSDREVPDPYYGGDAGFADVLAMVERTCATLVALLATHP